MFRSFLALSGIIAAAYLLGGCSTFRNSPYERPDCHSKSTNDDCTNFVGRQKVRGGFRDHGFDEAHRKQGYENLRERRRQQRDQRRRPQPQPRTDPGQGNPFEQDFDDTGTQR